MKISGKKVIFYLHDKIRTHFSASKSLFDQVMALRGELFRYQKGRSTQRIVLAGESYFIKQHEGVGWKEIFKNLLQGRLPVMSAKSEWQSIQKLQSLGIFVPELIGYGKRGTHPAYLQSFIILEDLKAAISLEDLTRDWSKKGVTFAVKRRLIETVAQMARILHTHGINHRDFYLCHFLLDSSPDLTLCRDPLKLYLIDLHRAQIRRLTPRRWIIKDLSSLYFSSKDIGLTKRDLYRFMKIYSGQPFHRIWQTEKTFWQKVKERGEKLYRDHSQ